MSPLGGHQDLITCYSLGVVTPMCVSLDLRYIWSNEVYVDVVYDHTKSSRIVCISSMQVYMVMNDIERCSVVLSIFFCSVLTCGVE